MIRKNFKFLLLLLVITIVFDVKVQVVQAATHNFSLVDLTMSFKDGTLPMKGNEPVTSLSGSLKGESDAEICDEISIVKWQKRQYIDEEWVDMLDTTFQDGYYYKPVFGTCISDAGTYSIDENSTIINVNGAEVDEYSEPNNIYKNWFGFKVDGTILINSIYETIIEPEVGNMPVTTMDVTTNPIGAYKVDKVNISWLESSDGMQWEKMDLQTPFKSGKYYMSEGVAGNYLSDGYVSRKNLNSSIINTSLDSYEDSDSYLNGTSLTSLKIYGPIYSYKFLDESGKKEFNEGGIKELSFRVDCSIDLFKEILIGNIKLIEDEDYELTEGSTIITLTKNGLSKINKLKSGNYDVKISFNNEKEPLLGSLVIKNAGANIANPATGDNILWVITIAGFSMSILLVSAAYLKKQMFE